MADEVHDEMKVKETLLGSIPFFVSLILLAMFVAVSGKAISRISDVYAQAAALIAFMFCTLKLIGWIKYPTIFLK